MRSFRALATLGLVACSSGSSPLDDGVAIATSRDARGVPRMLDVHGQFAASPREHVEKLAAQYGVAPDALPDLAEVGAVAMAHARVTRLAQSIDGLPIWDGELRVLVRDTGELQTMSGTLVGTTTPRGAKRFIDSESAAVDKAMR